MISVLRPSFFVILVLSLIISTSTASTNYTRPFLRSLIYDDQFIWKHLDGRLNYLRRADENNQTIGYVGLRDYFNLTKVYWPDNEYLASKNIEQYLYEELKANDIMSGIFFTSDIWHYSSEKDLIESGGWEANEDKCLADLKYLFDEITNRDSEYLFAPGRRRMGLLRWIDTWGRPPSETHWGSTFWKGSYRGCMLSSVPRFDNFSETLDDDKIKFNFCWAKLTAKDWPQKDVLIPKITIRSGICLPRSCDTIMARKQRQIIKALMQYNFSPVQRERFLSKPIDDIYCLPLKRPNVSAGSTFTPEAIWFFYVTGVWFSLIVASTVWFSFAPRPSRQAGVILKSFECLSIQRNWAEFVDNNEPSAESRVDLRALALVKLFSGVMVTFAHCFQFMYWFFYSSTIHILYTKIIFYLLSAWCLKSVDLFFIVSGILTAYVLLSKLGEDRLNLIIEPKGYLILNLARYVKFSPAMIVGLTFTKAVFIHIADGPYWDYATYSLSHQGRCQQLSWWRHLIWPIIFDVNATGGDSFQNECLPHSWYMVADMKMFMIVPFYLYALCRHKKWRLHLLAATALFSALWNYMQMNLQNLIYFQQNFTYGMIHLVSLLVCYCETSYYSPINRFYAMAFGLFAGIHLFNYKQGKIKEWPRYMRGAAMAAAILYQFYDLIFRTTTPELRYRATGEIPSEESLKWQPLFRQRFDAFVIVMILLRMASDWSGPLMRNASFFYKLSKLSYCVYIIHVLLIHYMITSTEFSRPDSEMIQFALFSVFIITMSFIIALPVYLMIESPLGLLLNEAFDKAKTRMSEATQIKSRSAKHPTDRHGKVVTSRANSKQNKHD